MLPTKLTPDDPESERARYTIVRRDSFADALPGGPILSANVNTGVALLRPPKSSHEEKNPVPKEFNFGPDGFRIVPR
jgi:hypothetical protein